MLQYFRAYDSRPCTRPLISRPLWRATVGKSVLLEKVPARVASHIQSQLREILAATWEVLVDALFFFIAFTVLLLCDKHPGRLIMQSCVVREQGQQEASTSTIVLPPPRENVQHSLRYMQGWDKAGTGFLLE